MNSVQVILALSMLYQQHKLYEFDHQPFPSYQSLSNLINSGLIPQRSTWLDPPGPLETMVPTTSIPTSQLKPSVEQHIFCK